MKLAINNDALIFGFLLCIAPARLCVAGAFCFHETAHHNEKSSSPRPLPGLMAYAVNGSPDVDINIEQKHNTDRHIVEDENAFDFVSGLACACLFESDLRRDAVGKPGGTQASSATNWINDKHAFALQNAFDKISLKLAEERSGLDRDEASMWIRWMRSVPTPLVVDLSQCLRKVANETITDAALATIDTSRLQFLSRLGCRLILLPSGSTLSGPLVEPPASIIYGKLLYGGVTRYRSLVSSNSNRPPRNAGERTEVKTSADQNVPAWLQYGGPNRMYEAVDMGAAAVMEIMLLPRGKELDFQCANHDMTVTRMVWSPQNMLGYFDAKNENMDLIKGQKRNSFTSGITPMTLSGSERNNAFKSDFQSSVGGLGDQIDSIVRRVLDGRVIRPAEDDDEGGIGRPYEQDEMSAELSIASMEAEELALLGLTPVKGLLLYGPPGCGKTALAREISRALRARAPKIVSAPELLDRWVGGSEKLVRALFADAEAELAVCNGDATRSALHVIVIDEIDAVFRKRSTAEDSGESTRSSVVNQILAKLDGVNAIPNVLLIGMTNRRELLDDALLRPGRLEVQIEIPLPDKEGRREILQIHFDGLRKKGRLSKPLCCAIDGVLTGGDEESELTVEDVSFINKTEVKGDDFPLEDISARVSGRKRKAIKRTVSRILKPITERSSYDLAADYATGGFSGADIAGLVRCAGSLALARARRDGGGVDGLLITLEDAKEALAELKG